MRILLIAAVLGIAIVALFSIGTSMINRFNSADASSYDDFTGPGEGSLILHINAGDPTSAIGDKLESAGGIASSLLFVSEAHNDSRVAQIQPGYYQLREKMSVSSAIDLLAEPNSRVGYLDVGPGQRLLDTVVVGGTPVNGILTNIIEASCIDSEQGTQCVDPQALYDTAMFNPAQELGVPSWSLDQVNSAPDAARRLEGLIIAGIHDFDPTADAKTILTSLISESAQRYNASGIEVAATIHGLTPYELLTAASLVEKEGLPQDFTKVARVILNRLAAPQRLEFDSTVNYSLDDQEIATRTVDRQRVTPWNTYAMDGLPYGPIGSPGEQAISAMEDPEEGPWRYFVTVNQDGRTEFSETFEQHQQWEVEANQSGILNSER